MSVNSPNMGLPVSTIGTDTGLQWEQNLNAAESIIDGHNHSPGSGVQITPSGINIDSDLALNSFNATLLRSVRFIAQSSPLAAATDLGCVYVSGVDLWFNDTSGNQVQLTSGGSVNATSSGISSGNASASFVASVLVVNQASNTPGNIQVGSVLIGQNVAGSNFITLSPPSGLSGGSYSLVLPTIPGTNSFVTLDTSGNFGTITQSGGLTGSNIANGTITNNKITAGTIQSSSLAILQVQGVSFSTTTASSNGTAVQVTGSSNAITIVGGTVVGMIFNGAAVTITESSNTPIVAQVQVRRNGTTIQTYPFNVNVVGSMTLPGSCINFIDFPGAGTWTYTIWLLPQAANCSISLSSGGFGIYEL